MAGLEDLLDQVQQVDGGLLSMASSLSGVTALLKNAGAQALAAATGFDSAAGRFRNAQGQFQTASSAASGMFQGAMNKIGSSAKGAAESIKNLGGVVKTLASADLPSAGQAMAMVGGFLGGLVTSGADKAAAALKMLGPEGEAAGVAIQGLAAVLSATIGLMATFMGMAIEAAQKLDIMRDRFAALAGSSGGGAAVQVILGKLSAALPFASSQISAWGQALLAAGVKGKQLEADIQAIAAATALMGESGGAAAETLFKRLGEGGPAADKLLKTFVDGGPKADKLLKEMGLSLADLGGQAAVAKMTTEQLHEALSKAMAKKGEGPLKDLALTLPAILQKAREGFLSLFNGAGPAVKAFMTAVKVLFAEFNKGSPLIKGLKPIVTDVLTTLFGWATRAVNVVHSLVSTIIGAGKGTGVFAGALSALKTGWAALVGIWKAVTTALGPVVSLLKAIFSNAMVLNGIKTLFTILVGVVTAFVVAIAGLAAAVGVVVGVVAGILGALTGLVYGAVGAAADFVAGLVEGITGGVGAVVDAVKGLASAAMGAFTSFFGIKSPSTKMRVHGQKNIAEEGLGEGMNRGTGKVRAAAKRLGEAADPSGAGGKGGRGADGGGGNVFNFNNCDFGGMTEGGVRRIFNKISDEMAGQAGAQPEPQGTG